jgi:predicted phage terminase large subunit-like protein
MLRKKSTGLRESRKYVFRKRLNYPDLKRAVKEQARRTCSRRAPDKILIEDKASGKQLIQDLKVEGVLQIVPYEPPKGADKLVRLYAQSAEFENGKVMLPRSAPWLDEYVRELTSFPGSKFDDQVDSTTQALEHMKIRSLSQIARHITGPQWSGPLFFGLKSRKATKGGQRAR